MLNWAAAANGHPEYIQTRSCCEVHYSVAGRVAWSQFVVKALDDVYLNQP